MESFEVTFKEFWRYRFALAQLFNPTHNIKEIYSDSGSIQPLTYFFDGLLKIGLAFFIWQIVTAFRKFIK